MARRAKKRKVHDDAGTRCNKRIKLQQRPQESQSVASVEHPVLSVYYPRVVTVRNYLLEFLSCDSRKYAKSLARLRQPRISLDADSAIDDKHALEAEIQAILDTTLVGCSQHITARQVRPHDLAHFSQQLQSSTNVPCTIASDRDPDVRLQIEVVNFVIWLLFRNGKQQHLLVQGYSRANIHGGLHGLPLTMAAGLPGVVCLYPNDHVATLTNLPWCTLLRWLGRGGDLAMVSLLFDHTLFIPVEKLRHDAAVNYYQLSGMPLSNLAMSMRTKPVIEDTQDEQQRKSNGCKNQQKNTCKEPRRLTDIRFVRHRILYAKPASNGRGLVRLGLRHIHVLNRFRDVQDFEQTVHVTKYVFPRQFRLHNAFTSEVDKRETSQAFKDYTLREQEITVADRARKKSKTWLPKRLRNGPVSFVQKMRKRHAQINITELLRKYCPLGQGCDCSLSTDSCTCPNHATSTSNVVRFVLASVSKLVPESTLGDRSSYQKLLKCIEHFIVARKFESMTIHEVMQGIKVTTIPWLSSEGLNATKSSLLDFNKRKEIFAEFVYWLFDSFIISLIRTNFYVTESNADKNRLHFYRQDVWRIITESSISRLKSTMYEELKAQSARKLLAHQKLSYGQVRLLPKKSSFRAITNLKKRPEYIQNGKRLLGKSTNALLAPVFKVLNHEVSQRPRHLGSSLRSVSSIQAKLSYYRTQLGAQKLTGQRLYFVKVDVQSCFDTIPPEKVLPLLEQLLTFELYSVCNSAQVHAPKVSPQAKGPSCLQPRVKFETLGKPAKKVLLVSDQAAEKLAPMHGGTVFVGNTSVQTRTKLSLLKLLKEHLESNLVKLGKKVYRQKHGIPQGSVMSGLLCNIFYAQLDAKDLQFTNKPHSVLMRLVDDFLLVTTEKHVASRFLQVMHGGIPAFGIQVKPEKSLTNFDIVVQGKAVNTCAGFDFPYCGALINTRTLDVTKDPARTSFQGIVDSLSVETSHLPGRSFRQKALNALRIQLHPFLFDTSHNCRHSVCRNLFDTLHAAALRMVCYIRDMPLAKRPQASLVIQTIGDMLNMNHRVLRRKAARADQKFECTLSKHVIFLVGLRAFAAVFESRQTNHTAVVEWIAKETVKCTGRVGTGEQRMLMKVMSEHEPPRKK